MKVHQREIVEVSFKFLDGSLKEHPALVVSTEKIQEFEPEMFYAVLISSKNIHPDLTLSISPEDLYGGEGKLEKQSYIVTHFLAYFTTDQITRKTNTFVKAKKFDLIVNTIIDNIFGDPLTPENKDPENPDPLNLN